MAQAMSYIDYALIEEANETAAPKGKVLSGRFMQNLTRFGSIAACLVVVLAIVLVARISGNEVLLYGENISNSPKTITEYMPRSVFLAVRKDTLPPLGKFVSIDKTVADGMFSNKLYCYVRFSKLGLKITYVFHGGKIDGLWLGYYDLNAR